MKFELGAYSFGAAGKNPEGETISTAQAVRNLLEQIRLAEQAGLDFYGVGEHHTATMPVSSPSAVINAAAAVTTTITLSTAVSVLSTDDPIRLYQQMATAAIVSGGRVEIIAGRGSSTDSFPLFGYDLDDYDRLYADKLGLLLAINDSPQVSWESPFRPPLKEALFIGRDGQAAKDLFFRHEQAAYAAFGRFPARSWPEAAPNYSPGGMVFAGHPEEIAERIVDLHRHLGHTRQFLQMDIGGMPHAQVLASIELLGTEVAPLVRAELNNAA